MRLPPRIGVDIDLARYTHDPVNVPSTAHPTYGEQPAVNASPNSLGEDKKKAASNITQVPDTLQTSGACVSRAFLQTAPTLDL